MKLLLLWLDPRPKLFIGDSGAYVQTALTGWIPRGPIVLLRLPSTLARPLAGQFYSALLIQALVSGVTAIVFALIYKRFFEMSKSISFVFGLLCALDPLQLVWERYVMTETFSLLFYALVVYPSLAYLRDRRLWQLAVVQALSVLLIGFRMSYLLVVQACTILLPLIALARCGLPLLHKRTLKTGVLTWLTYVMASVTMMLIMHGAYKYANVRLSNCKPAYLG